MIEKGIITQVDLYRAGCEVAQAYSAGATSILVDDAYDMDEDGGPAVIIREGTDLVIEYASIDLDEDRVYLSAPLAGDIAEGDTINRLPLSIEKRAWVQMAPDDEPVEARVPYTMQDRLHEGPRTAETGYESVQIRQDGSDWVLDDVFGSYVQIEGQFTDFLGDDDDAPPGGGGGTDGGNDDDGFVLPTMSEFVPDGPPEFYVDSFTKRVYTEDEAYSLDDAFIIYLELSAGSFTYDIEKMGHDYAQTLYPAWSIPLLGQDEKATIDSATASGLASTPSIDNFTGGNVWFGYMYDAPDGPKYFTMTNHFILQASWVTGPQYDDRTWWDANGNGDFPMPSSSEAETFPIGGDLHTRGMIVVAPVYWSSGGVDSPSTSIAMTGIRMEQA